MPKVGVTELTRPLPRMKICDNVSRRIGHLCLVTPGVHDDLDPSSHRGTHHDHWRCRSPRPVRPRPAAPTWLVDLGRRSAHVCHPRLPCRSTAGVRNADGQLGTGDHSRAQHVPRRVGTSTSWSSVSGRVRLNLRTAPARVPSTAGASNADGQLGTGDGTDRDTPKKVGTSTSWTSSRSVPPHVRAPRSGSLYCWGANYEASSGWATTWGVRTPKKVGTSASWKQVNTGDAHTCARHARAPSTAGGTTRTVSSATATHRPPAPRKVGSSTSWTERLRRRVPHVRAARSGASTAGAATPTDSWARRPSDTLPPRRSAPRPAGPVSRPNGTHTCATPLVRHALLLGLQQLRPARSRRSPRPDSAHEGRHLDDLDAGRGGR